MGQTASGEDKQASPITHKQLLSQFARQCYLKLEPIEQWSLKDGYKRLRPQNATAWSRTELTMALGMSTLAENYRTHILNIAYTAGRFPFMDGESKNRDEFTREDFVRLLTMSTERYKQVLGSDFDIIKYYFLLFLACQPNYDTNDEKSGSENESVTQTKELTATSPAEVFMLVSIPEKATISASFLVDIFSVLLLVSLCTSDGHTLCASPLFAASQFRDIDCYRPAAVALVRGMSLDVSVSDDLSEIRGSVSYKQFRSATTTNMPYLLPQFAGLVENLLFNDSMQRRDVGGNMEVESRGTEKQSLNPEEFSEPSESQEPAEPAEHPSADSEAAGLSRVLTNGTRAQLSVIFSHKIINSRLKKLYIASEAGFSMRSLETKLFHWRAPSLILVGGLRLPSEPRGPRHRAFDESFPPLWSSESSTTSHPGERLLFGFYVNATWKKTTKTGFGDEKTVLFQLQPIHDVFRPSTVVSEHLYFSVQGGGFGIGSTPPEVSVHSRKISRHTGNVSLSIDDSLQYGVFRHAGAGGSFHVSQLRPELEWEDRFRITDLEVWGCGGDKEVEEMRKRYEWEEREAKMRNQVNLKTMDDDRALLEMAGLIGNQRGSGGSV